MTFDIAKDAIDYVLTHQENFSSDSVIWQFTGGEPLLEIELMDEICDYIKVRTYELEHIWFNNYRISVGSNGLLYDDPRVQNFIHKNAKHISFGISIDGTKEKHDSQRIFPNGQGSYDEIMKRFPLWKEQSQILHTKATVSHDDLRMVKDSILHLWEIGIKDVIINCVFEDIWHDGDDHLLEQQLKELADTMIEKNMYQEYDTAFFERYIGLPLDPVIENNNWCGSGKMFAVSAQGLFYPCMRFAQYSLENRKEINTGNTQDGINLNRLRPFLSLNRTAQSPQECIDCEIASGCAWCQGYNYDRADTDTIFQRSTSICKMHKARVRANNYFWNQLDKIVPPPKNDTRIMKLQQRKGMQTLLLLPYADVSLFCHYPPPDTQQLPKETMSIETLKKVVYYALTHNLSINVILGKDPLSEEFLKELNQCSHLFLRPISTIDENDSESLFIYDFENDLWNDSLKGNFLILRINRENLPQLPEWLKQHSFAFDRISLIIKDLTGATENDFATYQTVLHSIATWLPEREEQKPLELSFLTDRLTLTEPNHCDAGIKHLTVAPDGGFYLCPGFYHQGLPKITDIAESLKTHEIPIKNKQLLQLDHAPICETCDAYHCKRCIFLNKQTTLEINTPSRQQCVYSHLERNVSQTLIEPLFLQDDVSISEIDYLDPFDKLITKNNPFIQEN
jgi:radical SAM peptide maturase (CXXX-repeat target family)/CXXX repeat peptide maturase